MNNHILHIPHSQIHVPNYSGFILRKEEIISEINLLTDWATDTIFDVPESDKLIVSFSRVFCDVERFYDEAEPMAAKGAGIAYTHTDSGKFMRQVSDELKQNILDNYYKPHQDKLNQLAQDHLNSFGQAIIIDCHSFSSKPLIREFDQSTDRPDICLGSDPYHTPEDLINQFQTFFRNQGLKVAVNKPYSGSMVPGKYYNKNKQVQSIMIEVNKKLYMDETTYKVVSKKVKQLNQMMIELLRHE